jgi:hypothetical protein
MKPIRIVLTVFVLSLCVAAPVAAAASGQSVIPLSSPVYGQMDELSLLLGYAPPSGSRPWTKAEARRLFGRMRPEHADGPVQLLVQAIEEQLDEQLRWSFSDGFSAGANLDLAGEVYAHTATDEDLGFTSSDDWIYGFVDREPLARLRLDMAVSDFFYTYCDLQYGYGLATYDDQLATLGESGHSLVGALTDDTDLVIIDRDSVLSQYTDAISTNFILNSRDFDFQWPKRAIVSVGGNGWNVTAGRDKISWGNSHIGNFIFDDHVDYHEYARFVAYTDFFKYEATDVFFDTSYADSDDFFRMMLTHRLEFRPFRSFSFAVSENVMYQDDVLDFRYLNPAFVYHNLNDRDRFNAIAHLEANYSPRPGLRLYTQFVLDQAIAPNEDDDESTAWGLLAGIEYATVFGNGIYATAFEGAVTLPCLYRRDGIDFLMATRYAGLNSSGNSHWYAQKFDYIGFPYGSDALVFRWENSYRLPAVGKMGFTLTGIWHGEVDMYTDVVLDGSSYANYGSSLFIGDEIDQTVVVSLEGERSLSTRFDPTLYGRLDLVIRSTYSQSDGSFGSAQTDLQCTVGAVMTI